MAQIKEALLDFNPWWKGKFAIEFKEREVYSGMKKFLPLKQIIALNGLRRTGKTTIMLKIASDSIAGGLEPKAIIYFSFDEFKGVELRDVIRAYEEIMGFGFKDAKKLILLDEIQKLENWENQLKTIYDLYGKDAKIIISGSESLFIRKKSKETLAGRIFEFKVEPLSFAEFLVFTGKNQEPAGLFEKETASFLNEYKLTQGFPELAEIKDKEIIKKYIKEGIIDKIIYRDIPNLFKIKDPAVLEALLNIFMEEPGQLVEIIDLANQLKISRQAVSKYLAYLEDSFLIRKLYNFSRSRRKTERKLKKYYPSIASVDIIFREDELAQSKVFEWLLVNQLKAEFFWRDSYKNEVDIVLPEKNPVPVEIKYGKIELGGVLAFMKQFNVKEGYIISKEKESVQASEGKTILIRPAYKFLLEKRKV